MSSWFDQLDIGVDLNALQEHLVKSVEEATELVDSLGRMEIMNLDEMAEKQEAEEREEEEEIIEEIIIHDDSIYDDIPGEVIYHDHIGTEYSSGRSQAIQNISHDDLAHLVAVTDDIRETDALSSAYDHSETVFTAHQTPKRGLISQNSLSMSNSVVKKVVSRKSKKPKKKKKVLDFFGTGDYADDEDHDNSKSQQHHSNNLPAVNVFDNDVGFALGSLFDAERPPEEPSSSYIGPEADSSSGSGPSDEQQSGGNSSNSVVGSVLSMTLPTSFSFFDTIDEEINLDEDPILQQVERNRVSGVDQTPIKPSYIAYLESVLPPPSRLFGYDEMGSSNTTDEDQDQRRRRQQQQQQVDRILGLTNSSKGFNPAARSCVGYSRNCLIQSRNILCYDLFVTIASHSVNGWKVVRENLWPIILEQLQLFFNHLKHSILPPDSRVANFSNRLSSLYQSLKAFGLLVFTLVKVVWAIVYVLLRALVSILWHIIQVCFLSSLYLLQCLRPVNSPSPASTAEERLQQWRTRWRSFAEDYLSSNNALMLLTAVLFVYTYYRFQRYGTDAGDR